MLAIHNACLIGLAAMLGLFEGPAEIACVCVLITTLIIGGYKDWRPGIPEVGLVMYGAAGIYGALLTDAPLSSEDVLRPLLGLGFVVGSRAIARADDRTLGRMAWAFAGCMLLNGAYGYLQLGFGQLPLDQYLAKNPNSPQTMIPGHVWEGLRGASGLFYNRLKLAHVGIIALGLLGLAFLRPKAERNLRIAVALGALVLGGAIAFTYARMAIIAFAGASFLTLLLMGRTRLVLAGAAAAAIFSGVIGFSAHGRERLMAIGSDLEVRLSIVKTAFKMFWDHPLLGVGHGVYRTVSSSYASPGDWGSELIDGHNLFAHVLAETGLIGFLGLAATLLVSLFAIVRRVRRDKELGTCHAILDRLALYSFLAVLMLGVTHFPLHHATVALLFWMAVGVAAARVSGSPTV